MRIISLLSILLLAACGNPGTTSKNTSSTPDSPTAVTSLSQNQIICFLHLDGKEKQDTSYIRLEINNNKVSGIYNYIPFEKDRSKGSLTGTLENDIIDAEWYFMQEGMQDSLHLKFKLYGEKLYQQKYEFSPVTGRRVVSDTARFDIEYHRITCK